MTFLYTEKIINSQLQSNFLSYPEIFQSFLNGTTGIYHCRKIKIIVMWKSSTVPVSSESESSIRIKKEQENNPDPTKYWRADR